MTRSKFNIIPHSGVLLGIFGFAVGKIADKELGIQIIFAAAFMFSIGIFLIAWTARNDSDKQARSFNLVMGGMALCWIAFLIKLAAFPGIFWLTNVILVISAVIAIFGVFWLIKN